MRETLLAVRPHRSEGIRYPSSNTEGKYGNPTRLGTRTAVSL